MLKIIAIDITCTAQQYTLKKTLKMGELIVGERARAVKMLAYGLLLRQVVFTSNLMFIMY